MPDGYECAVRLLPHSLQKAAQGQSSGVRCRAEEFRLRSGRAPSLRLPEGEYQLSEEIITPEKLAEVLETASSASMHAVRDELRRGFLNAPGGVRVGVCGTAVTDGHIRNLRDISSVSIRIPRQIREAGQNVIPLVEHDSVLILSPPGGGKTTLLRELVRSISDKGVRVSLADERGELAGMWNGVPQFDLGRCTDVITAAPKAEAAMLLLRAMAPEVVAMDEISAAEDIAAIETLLGSGVRVFATAHAATKEEFLHRPIYRRLAELGAFQKLICIRGGKYRHYEVDTL